MSHIEEVTTLFVVGFPEDITEREFSNMFLFANGFEAASLKSIESDPDTDNKYQAMMGFAKFTTRQEAIDAQQILNGKLVDSDKLAMLKVELAKKNLHVKRKSLNLTSPTSVEMINDQEKHWESFVDDLTTDNSSDEVDSATWKSPTTELGGAFRIPPKVGLPSLHHHSERVQRGLDELLKFPADSPFTTRFSPFPTMFSEKMQMMNLSPSHPTSFRATPVSFSDRRTMANPPTLNGDHNPPCNTLYVGNLPPNTIEEELRQLFSGCLGYKRLCVRYKAGANPKAGPMCFVEFDSEEEAAASMAEKNGTLLSNSEKGGIRLSFSKNPLGVRRPPPQPVDVSFASHSSHSTGSASFLPTSLSAFGGAPGLAFPGFSTPATPTGTTSFSATARPLTPWN